MAEENKSSVGAGDALDLLLAILSFANPQGSDASKAIGAAKLASTGADVAGYPGASGALGLGAGAAGFGLNLANLAGSNLSTREKVGEGVGGAFDLGASALIPYYGQSKLVAALGRLAQESGSPQVRGFGRAVEQTGEPQGAKIFNASIRGRNPWEGMNSGEASQAFILDLLGPLGAALEGAGVGGKVTRNIMDYGPIPGGGWLMKKLGMFGHEPTTGTQFRDVLNKVIGKAGFEGFKGTEQYNMDPAKWQALDPKTRDAATVLGYTLASVTPQFKKNPYAYGIQAQNVLLNQYGDQVQEHAARLLEGAKPEDVLKQVASAGELQPDQLQSVWRALAGYYGLPATTPMPRF